MRHLKLLITGFGLLAAAAILVFQQVRISRLAAEGALLREQIQQRSAPDQVEEATGPERGQETSTNLVPSLTAGQFSELLRLRGEVGILRAQLAEAARRARNSPSQRLPPGVRKSRQELAQIAQELDQMRKSDSEVALQSLNAALSETDPAKRRRLLISGLATLAQDDTDAALAWVQEHVSDPGEKETAINAIRTVAPVGIGAELAQQEGYAVVNRLFPGSPAQLSEQLHPGDRILAVAQGDNAFVDARDVPLADLVQAIRGAPGTQIQLQVIPAGAAPDTPVTVNLVRDQIKFKK